MSLCSLPLSLETPDGVHLVAEQSQNSQATSKGSDQTGQMHRLSRGFTGRTYHIVGNLMHWLIYYFLISNNKGADQTAWMHRLVCTFVVCMIVKKSDVSSVEAGVK